MVKFNIKKLDIWFGAIHALKNINMEIYAHEILSVIGPANSGKTTFLRMLDRLNELEMNFMMDGLVEMDGKDVTTLDKELLRRKVGMVFALPTPLPFYI